MFVQIPVDRRLEVDQRMKDAAFETAAGELGEKALDRVEPGGRSRDEMKGPARMAVQPRATLGCLWLP